MVSAALAVLELEGQRSELSEIYEKYRKRFLGIAMKILHNRENAEDAVQEAFLRIADNPGTFFSLNGTKRIGYICTAVKNVSYVMYNKRKKLSAVELTEEMVFNDDPDPLESLMISDFSHGELIGFIDSLPPLWQSVLVLTRISGLSIAETARTLKISEAAVNQRLYLARKAIRQFVDERRRGNG